MQQEMTHHMLRTFSDSFEANESLVEEVRENADPDTGPAMYQGVDLTKADSQEMQAVLTDTVLGEFKTRLARIGLEYLPPAA